MVKKSLLWGEPISQVIIIRLAYLLIDYSAYMGYYDFNDIRKDTIMFHRKFNMSFSQNPGNFLGLFVGKTLGFIGLLLAAAGTLSVLFPKVIAYFWATLMFIGAFYCFSTIIKAWMLLRRSQKDNFINVEVHNVEDDFDKDKIE